METLIVLLALVIGAIIYFRRPAISDDSFTEAGVSVDYVRQTINIQGSQFPTCKVRSIRWEEEGGGSAIPYTFAFIHVADMKRPVFRIRFMNPKRAETFCTRLQLALEEAATRAT